MKTARFDGVATVLAPIMVGLFHASRSRANTMTNAASVRRRLLLAACAMPLLDACAPIVARDPNAPADFALITMPSVAKLSLIIDKHPDATTSIERALMFQGDIELGINRLTDAMRTEPTAGDRLLTTLSATLERELVAALLSAGKTVVAAPDTHLDRIELLSNYPSFKARANRILDVLPRTMGFWSTYPERIYRPWVRVEYRVFDVRTSKNVATGGVGSGVPMSDMTWTNVATDERYVFPTYEELVESPARAAEALRATSVSVARALAAQLATLV